MMRQVEAVYENGLLRPLEPLSLRERQRVTVVITDARPHANRSHPDSDYLEAVKQEVESMDQAPALEEIHRITSKDAGSWAEAIVADRQERF